MIISIIISITLKEMVNESWKKLDHLCQANKIIWSYCSYLINIVSNCHAGCSSIASIILKHFIVFCKSLPSCESWFVHYSLGSV